MSMGSIGTASEPAGGGGGGSGIVESIVEGKGIVVDASDPANPIVGQASANYRLNVRLIATSNHALTGLAAIDSVVPVAGDRICLNGQTAPAENGIWVAAAGAWSRATDFDAAADMVAGLLVSVSEGTVYADSLWMFATTGAITVGTTALAFASVGPSFGADTRINLPNSAAALVEALQVLTTLPVNTAGAETSELDFYLRLAGVKTLAIQLFASLMRIPDSLFFKDDTDTGLSRAGTDNFGVYCGNQNVLAFTTAGITLNAAIAANLLWGAGAGSVAYDSGTGRLTLSPAAAQGNVVLGLTSLANTATHGFPCIPVVTGVPTGVVSVPAGMMALAINGSTGKLYGSTGGGVWTDISGA